MLSVIYPRRRVERDIAEAEKAALGITDAHRVPAVVDDPGASARFGNFRYDQV